MRFSQSQCKTGHRMKGKVCRSSSLLKFFIKWYIFCGKRLWKVIIGVKTLQNYSVRANILYDEWFCLSVFTTTLIIVGSKNSNILMCYDCLHYFVEDRCVINLWYRQRGSGSAQKGPCYWLLQHCCPIYFIPKSYFMHNSN